MILKNLCLSAMLLVSAGAFADNTRLVTGNLPNGLSYYILPNSTPSNSVDFFLAQRAGSVCEEESQRGLAHFLEHLCFNGTEHFPGNSLISYLESVGVKFGANLNAYTSTDETLYNISKVPTRRRTTLDSCFLILRDWSCGLTIDPKAVEEERGVIVNEWRHRNTPTGRMLEKALPHVYPGSIYGQRMPIGLMEVVENCDPSLIRGFYSKWYHPGNQALVVVGDIDATYAEGKIKELFSPIKPGKALITGFPAVAENDSIIVECLRDPEQTTDMLQLYFRHPEYKDALAAELATAMLAARFDEVELSPECPHSYLGVGDVKFLMSHDVYALVMRGVVRPGHEKETIRLWTGEAIRALRHGFTAAELELAKVGKRKELEEKIRKASRITNTEMARRLSRHFLDRTEPEMPVDEYRRDLARLDSITLADTDEYIRSVVSPEGHSTVILLYQPDNVEVAAVAPGSLAEAFSSGVKAGLPPYELAALDRPLLASEPQRGSIRAEKDWVFPGTREYILSNGIKVLAWHNSEVPGQVYVRGIGRGGLSQCYTSALAPTMKLLNEALAVSGYGDHSALDLRRILQGKEVKVSVSVSNTEETVEASAGASDLEDAFRLLYLKATAARPDKASVDSWLAGERAKLRNRHVDPIQVMGDSIHRNVYNRHPLGFKTTVETLDAFDYPMALELYRDRFSDMGDFVFYVAGDYEEDALKDCLERYVASLPAAGRLETPKDIDYCFTPANQTVEFSRPMENPVGVVYNFYTGPGRYELADVIAANAFGQILKRRLLADLREKRGWTYSIQGHGSVSAGMNGDDAPSLMMPVYIKVEPGHEAETAEIVNATVEDMLSNGVSAEELGTVKEYLAKTYEENIADNGYLLAVMKAREVFGRDMHSGYLETLRSLADLRPYMRPLTTYRSLLIMRPEASPVD